MGNSNTKKRECFSDDFALVDSIVYKLNQALFNANISIKETAKEIETLQKALRSNNAEFKSYNRLVAQDLLLARKRREKEYESKMYIQHLIRSVESSKRNRFENKSINEALNFINGMKEPKKPVQFQYKTSSQPKYIFSEEELDNVINDERCEVQQHQGSTAVTQKTNDDLNKRIANLLS